VLGTIAAARLVITSSLHALIAADALGVPHVLELSDKVTGGIYKFNDYGSAFGDRIVPGKERLTDRAVMAQRQEGLRAALWQV
jgi:Polysaccharide pyruvyl transferase